MPFVTMLYTESFLDSHLLPRNFLVKVRDLAIEVIAERFTAVTPAKPVDDCQIDVEVRCASNLSRIYFDGLTLMINAYHDEERAAAVKDLSMGIKLEMMERYEKLEELDAHNAFFVEVTLVIGAQT